MCVDRWAAGVSLRGIEVNLLRQTDSGHEQWQLRRTAARALTASDTKLQHFGQPQQFVCHLFVFQTNVFVNTTFSGNTSGYGGWMGVVHRTYMGTFKHIVLYMGCLEEPLPLS